MEGVSTVAMKCRGYLSANTRGLFGNYVTLNLSMYLGILKKCHVVCECSPGTPIFLLVGLGRPACIVQWKYPVPAYQPKMKGNGSHGNEVQFLITFFCICHCNAMFQNAKKVLYFQLYPVYVYLFIL